jgi:M6 family metalloprotease-like protein
MREIPSRSIPPRRVALCTCLIALAVVGLSPFAPPGGMSAASTCVVLPENGKLPPHVAEARRLLAAETPADPGGWVLKAERARQNRKDLAAGAITEREAEDSGGLAAAGDFFLPVLPTLYADVASAPVTAAALQQLLFGSNPLGSMTAYYEQVSYGNLNVTGAVTPWRSVDDPMLTYTINNGLGGWGKAFVREAVAKHDASIDFGLFDNDGPDGIPNSADDDGAVDCVVVVYPTAGAECMGGGVNMWSHHAYLTGAGGSYAPTTDPRFGGGFIRVDRYFVAPALSCSLTTTHIGVYCHEMGHALGIPDLYDTQEDNPYQGDSRGLGHWCLMAGGSGNSPQSPAHMSAFVKERLGWLTYFNVAQDMNDLCLPPVETNPYAARVWWQGAVGPEYFIAENRQRIGFDANLWAEGLVIYHVDEDVYDALKSTNTVNAFETHKAVDVECADGIAGHVLNADDLDSNENRGDAQDVWCLSGGGRHFTPDSSPDSRSYSGTDTEVSIKNIGACNGGDIGDPDWVCADYLVGAPSPVDLCIEDCASDNCNQIATCGEYWASPNIWIDNDSDGQEDVPSPGMSNKLWVRYENLGPEMQSNATVNVYAAPGTAGLEWPADAEEHFGEVTASILAAGDYTERPLFVDYPELFEPQSHWCIGVVADDSYPPGSTQANLSNNVAQVNSQVLMTRPGGAAKTLACPGPLTVESKIYLRDGFNPTQDIRKAIVRVGSPPGFNDVVIPPDDWYYEILPHTGPFFLSPGMRDSITVRVWALSAVHGEIAHIPVTLWDDDLNIPIGGVTVDVIVDCWIPAVPQNGTAQWTDPPGDDPSGPTVLVQWDPVSLDTNGNPETVLYYEVYRKLGGFIYIPVDSVAVDAQPLLPGFQWYDDLPRDLCPTVAQYRVRAIDGAGSAGDLSDPIDLPCVLTSVGAGAPAGASSQATPNPFRKTTSITFKLAVAGHLALEIFNAQGERVRTLANGLAPAGGQSFEWDGRNDAGKPAVNGVYFYRILGSGISETRKIVLAR